MAGYGDDLIATGLAKGVYHSRRKRIAFGDGKRLAWYKHSAEIFHNNPNIATPGTEFAKDVEWIDYRKGNRLYNRDGGDHWVWNYKFKATPGELYLDDEEEQFMVDSLNSGFVVIEPNVEWNKRSAKNKDWGFDRYQIVADYLIQSGYRVIQFDLGKRILSNVEKVSTPSFRHSMAIVQRASLVVTPEGGLHHGAAAVGTKAVVIFGGWIPPEATGYKMHVNLAVPGKACGRYDTCAHCRWAMDQITTDQVIIASIEILRREKAA